MSLLNSNVWRRIVKQLQKDRADLLEELTQPLDLRATDRLRGRIQQIDDIIECYPSQIKNTDT